MASDNLALHVAASLCAAVSLALVWKWREKSRRSLYPPGPKGYPLIGNIWDIPQDIPVWQAYIPLAQKFDTDVLYLKLLTRDFVVLNSAEAIKDLTEKRSNIYCDRPNIPMVELMGVYSWDFVLIGYGSQWRRSRRLFHEFFNVKVVSRFDDCLDRHTRRFLSHLAETPDAFLGHIQFVTGAVVMEVTYGMDITSHEDKFLQAAELAQGHLESAVVPGGFLVDMFPILRHVPSWFPGTEFKRIAKAGRELFAVAIDGPLDYVKESLKANKSNASVAALCFDRVAELRLADQGFDESVIRSVTASLYIAATDTTHSVLRTFILVAALHPHVMRKAQEELDRVVGGERLPQLSDQEDLHYISALIKELLRWACPVPFGVPKRAMEDNIYKGYFIPAGATIIENVWAVCYDETVYPEPHTYDPERFLKDGKLDRSVKDPEDRIFGAGRRVCPGRWFASRLLFLNIACILAVFDIEAPVGEKLEPKFHESHVRHAIPFKCVIKPRSGEKLKLVQDATTGLT